MNLMYLCLRGPMGECPTPSALSARVLLNRLMTEPFELLIGTRLC